MSDFESGAFNRALPTLLPDKFTRKRQIGKGRAGKVRIRRLRLHVPGAAEECGDLSAASSQKREDSGRDDNKTDDNKTMEWQILCGDSNKKSGDADSLRE
jgi:hypothetical protein